MIYIYITIFIFITIKDIISLTQTNSLFGHVCKRFRPTVLYTFCLMFCQFQPSVAYKSVAFKKACKLKICFKRICFWTTRSKPPEVFYKIGYSYKYRNIYRKDLCWSLLLIKLQAWKPAALLKRYSNTSVFLWIGKVFFCEIFTNTYCEKHLQTAASEQPSNFLENWRYIKIQGYWPPRLPMITPNFKSYFWRHLL